MQTSVMSRDEVSPFHHVARLETHLIAALHHARCHRRRDPRKRRARSGRGHVRRVLATEATIRSPAMPRDGTEVRLRLGVGKEARRWTEIRARVTAQAAQLPGRERSSAPVTPGDAIPRRSGTGQSRVSVPAGCEKRHLAGLPLRRNWASDSRCCSCQVTRHR